MPFLEHCRLFLRKIVKFVFGSGLDIGLYILVKKQRLKSYFRLILLKTNFVLVREFVQHTAPNTISNAFVPGTPEHRLRRCVTEFYAIQFIFPTFENEVSLLVYLLYFLLTGTTLSIVSLRFRFLVPTTAVLTVTCCTLRFGDWNKKVAFLLELFALVINTLFHQSVSINFQGDRWWEYRKASYEAYFQILSMGVRVAVTFELKIDHECL